MTAPIVLLVEDSLADVALMEEAFAEQDVQANLHTVNDGAAALDFLHRRGEYEKAPRPDLVILDLNLPRKHGLEVLGDLKSDESLARIPVMVMSTSAADDDVDRAYDLHANCFVTKPHDLDQYIDLVDLIRRFWLRAVRYPDAPSILSA